MTDSEYLEAVLRDQMLVPGGPELAELERQRKNVEAILLRKFGHANPIIRVGGSRAKNTMNREVYDLDMPIYVDHDENGAGETLEEIYNTTADAMSEDYYVERRRSALRLRNADPERLQEDTHVDVVPGRYFDASRRDAWIYQHHAEKCRLKTNLDIHIEHIRDSGVRQAIRLGKLWNVREGVGMKTFVLELLIVDLLTHRKSVALSAQIRWVLEQFRDDADGLSVVDPANAGNDLTPAMNAVKGRLVAVARETLRKVDDGGWESVFGTIKEADRRSAAIRIATAVPAADQYKPWSL